MSEAVRDLTPTQAALLRKRMERIARAADELRAAQQDWEDAIQLVTGGDPELGVDLKRGVIVRKGDDA